MSKTTPVRWWRNEATRYVTRGPQVVPAAPAPEWKFDLLAPLDPTMTVEPQRMYDAATSEALAAAMALPADVLQPSQWSTYRPIEDDLRVWQADVERIRRAYR